MLFFVHEKPELLTEPRAALARARRACGPGRDHNAASTRAFARREVPRASPGARGGAPPFSSSTRRQLKLRFLVRPRSDLDISDGCLDQYKHFESEKKYTRNLIATDGERFTLMLLCWNGGKESPVHDHPCRGCWMRVCEGSVTETRYARKDGSLVEVGAGTFESPAVAYVHGERKACRQLGLLRAALPLSPPRPRQSQPPPGKRVHT